MTHAQHAMHGNSLAAYAAARDILCGRKLQAIEALHQLGRPATDRELAESRGKARDYFQPRCSDLIKEGVLVEVDRVECPHSGHMVRRVWFALAMVEAAR